MSKKISFKSEKSKETWFHFIYQNLSAIAVKNEWRAQTFFITYTENCGLAIDACSDREHIASL